METIGEFTFEPICDKYTEEIKSKVSGPRIYYGDVVVHPSKCVLNEKYKDYADRIRDFKVYPDDVWVVTFPKCGTTWTQEMVWLLVNNLNYEKAKQAPLTDRFPFIEWESFMIIKDNSFMQPTMEMAKNAPRPRCIKSHLPLQLLPKDLWTVKPKIIYVVRDPRDAAISYYHHYRLWNAYSGSLEDFIEVFLADRVLNAPFWSHVLDFYKIKDEPNILFNTYEEMKRDLSGVIKKTADFLKTPINEIDVERLREHLSFKNMKNNVSCNYTVVSTKVKEKRNQKDDDENLFMIRKGESGGWKKLLSKDLIEKFDSWNRKHLDGTGFTEYPWS